MALFKNDEDRGYAVVVQCPWCGQRTTKFQGRMKDAASDCAKYGCRFYNASTLCYVPYNKLDQVDKNKDEPLIR